MVDTKTAVAPLTAPGSKSPDDAAPHFNDEEHGLHAVLNNAGIQFTLGLDVKDMRALCAYHKADCSHVSEQGKKAKKAEPAPPAAPVAPASVETPAAAPAPPASGAEEPAKKDEAPAPAPEAVGEKPVSQMNKDELVAKAGSLGIPLKGDEKNADLVGLINAQPQA